MCYMGLRAAAVVEVVSRTGDRSPAGDRSDGDRVTIEVPPHGTLAHTASEQVVGRIGSVEGRKVHAEGWVERAGERMVEAAALLISIEGEPD